MKFLNVFYFCGPFLLSWIRIRIHSRSETLLKTIKFFLVQVPFWSATTRGRVVRLRDGIPGSDQAVVSWTADSCPLHQAAQHRGGGSPHQGLEWRRICTATFCSDMFDLFLIITASKIKAGESITECSNDSHFFYIKKGHSSEILKFSSLKLLI